MKKTQIGKKLYNVITGEQYITNTKLYNPRLTAVEVCGGKYVMPVLSRPDQIEPGIYYPPNGMVGIINKPTDISEYRYENVIDYTKATSINDIFENNKLLRDIQDDIITTSDNVLKLNISDQDTPEIRYLKMAINNKGIDKKQYEDRFDQFQNDMRLLTKGHSITLGKLISISTAFDIAVELTLKDRAGAPNPIGREYVVDLTVDRPEE